MPLDSPVRSVVVRIWKHSAAKLLVGYDLDEEVISFAPVDCATFSIRAKLKLLSNY